MQFLKRRNDKKNEQATVHDMPKKRGEKFSYENIITKKYKEKVRNLEKEVNELKKSEKEVIESIEQVREVGGGDGELISIIRKIRGEINASQIQLANAREEFEKQTLGLRLLAINLDNIDRNNTLVDLYQFLGVRVNEMLAVLNKIEIVSGGNYYAPASCAMIKDATIKYIIPNLNIELSKLHKTDEKSKKELTDKFHKEIERVDAEIEKTKTVSEKYKTFLNK
ncbi:hypothetical protein [Clostridium sp. BNL1100]|uniref:hypothetical protein n=1 Tax=Clostridium sp. BNL1100 TaxID=755731 RepID=UPI00024A7F32|nr:hypothetical protein [Clostridium sp. BNL1100]AEY65835.1 hypothetical protein Clo1100_1621 [Clostridium sp. BNL1100]